MVGLDARLALLDYLRLLHRRPLPTIRLLRNIWYQALGGWRPVFGDFVRRGRRMRFTSTKIPRRMSGWRMLG